MFIGRRGKTKREDNGQREPSVSTGDGIRDVESNWQTSLPDADLTTRLLFPSNLVLTQIIIFFFLFMWMSYFLEFLEEIYYALKHALCFPVLFFLRHS